METTIKLANVPAKLATFINSASSLELTNALFLGYNTLKQMKKLNICETNTAKVASKSSIAIGKEAENDVIAAISKVFKCENVSNRANCGDINLVDYKIMIEVKNYKTVVPQQQIDKFYDNLVLYSGGIFISFSSIVNMPNFAFKTSPKPCIFISLPYFDENMIIFVIKLLIQYITTNVINSIELSSFYERINILSEESKKLSLHRCKLQKKIGDISMSLIESSTNIAQIEHNLINSSALLLNELKDCGVRIYNPFTELGAWVKQTEFTKTTICKILEKINPSNDVPEWKIGAKKCSHLRTGIIFNMLNTTTNIGFPIEKLKNEKILECLKYGKKVELSDNILYIDISESTNLFILELLDTI